MKNQKSKIKNQNQSLKLKTVKIFALLAVVLSFELCTLHFDKAEASALSLGVYPPLIRIITNGANKITTPLTIQNFGNDPLRISILLKPFESSKTEDGEVSFLPDNSKLPKGISILDNDITVSKTEIGGKQTKTLNLNIDADKSGPGDYYFSIVFLSILQAAQGVTLVQEDTFALPRQTWLCKESPCTIRAQSSVSLGIAADVLLTVGKEKKANGAIEEFSTSLFKENGPVAFAFRVKNNGNQIIQPQGHILVKNIFNQAIGKIDLNPAYVLKGSVRSMPLLWKENFLLGPYTATLNLSLSKEGPILTESIYFFSFPFKKSAFFIFIIFIIIFIKTKLKTKIKKSL